MSDGLFPMPSISFIGSGVLFRGVCRIVSDAAPWATPFVMDTRATNVCNGVLAMKKRLNAKRSERTVKSMNAIDPYEQVIEVEVDATPDGHPASDTSKTPKRIKRFVISDLHPDVRKIAHYRTNNPPEAFDAWIRFAQDARWFLTRAKATDALFALWGERCMRDSAYSDRGAKQIGEAP